MAASYPARPTSPACHVRSHTGRVVHRGTWVKAPHTLKSDGWATPGWITAQACGNSHRAIAYGHPTDEAATCKRCGPAPALTGEACTACQGGGKVAADWSDEPVTCLDCYGSGSRDDQARELDRRARQAEAGAALREMQRRAGGRPAVELAGVLDVATDPSALF